MYRSKGVFRPDSYVMLSPCRTKLKLLNPMEFCRNTTYESNSSIKFASAVGKTHYADSSVMARSD